MSSEIYLIFCAFFESGLCGAYSRYLSQSFCCLFAMFVQKVEDLLNHVLELTFVSLYIEVEFSTEESHYRHVPTPSPTVSIMPTPFFAPTGRPTRPPEATPAPNLLKNMSHWAMITLTVVASSFGFALVIFVYVCFIAKRRSS